MKNGLCVLLALSPCAAVAQDALLTPFRTTAFRETPFSLIGAVPDAFPTSAPGPRAGRVLKLGLLTAELPFPLERRPAEPLAGSGADVRAALRNAFHFDPAKRDAYGETGHPAEETILQLQPYHVFGHSERETIEAIDAQEAAQNAEEFNARTGGRLGSASFGPFEVDLGMWKPKSVIPFPKIVTPPEIELLRFKW
jgi:hypothetical protein